jgi:hypothetical protein
VQVAWGETDKPERRLLARTLLEQLWMIDSCSMVAKPAEQFIPFFRLLQDTGC